MTNARFDAASVKADEDRREPDRRARRARTPQELRAELMLVATGRAANIEDIGLETTKVETDRGIIKVNGRMRTKEPHVYAIGDIVGGLWLAHTAGHEGIIAAHIDRRRVRRPRDGLRQAAARDVLPPRDRLDRPDRGAGQGGAATPYKVGKVPFQAIAKAIIGGEYEGFAKVIADKDTDDTLGVHIVGPHATDLIAEASRSAFALEADAVGDRRARPTPTRPCPRSSARRPWPSTDGRSTSDGAGPGSSRGRRRRSIGR